MSRKFTPHLSKFIMYFLSGSTAAFADIGSYLLMLHIGVWYILASVISGIIGFFTAFLLHKYIVFQKKSKFLKHLRRYFMVDMVNLVIITVFLYALVDFWGIDPAIAKFVALTPVVLWNFFIYRFVVYV
ncbi:GtrA family protein [Patescibacteria group bacterium]|nr:GtrA family protein [Patescibacteria group bacterium]